jgi:hypothetical protein
VTATAYWPDAVERFVEYVARYAPTFPERMGGASAAQIDEAEQLAGTPFPPEYRAFLRAMGDTPDGALTPFLEHTTFGIAALQQFYRTPGVRPHPEAVYLWTYEVDAPYDIFIDIRGGERDVRPLWQAGWAVDDESGALHEQQPELVSQGGSLFQSLYTDAFLHLRDPLLEYATQLRDRAAEPAGRRDQAALRTAVASVAAHLQFAQVPFLAGDQLFFDRADASLKLYAQPGANVIYVKARTETEAGRLAEVLADNLDMTIWR